MSVPVKINVSRRSGDYHACLDAQRGIWGCGTSSDAAIGSLVKTHPEEFDVEIKLPQGTVDKTLTNATRPPADPLLGEAREAFRLASRIMLDWPTPDAQEAVHLAAVALRKLSEPGRQICRQVHLDRALTAVEQVTRNWELVKGWHRDAT